MKILVRFKGDNDFGSVMRAFGNLLLKRMGNISYAPTPERIALWFNTISQTLYEMAQQRGDDEPDMGKYLQINPEDVFVNEAADEKMKTAHEWSNGDSVMVDDSLFEIRERIYLI